ncbi:unnamed protein product [Microthlaspi erraticum]|uniref:Uncharacterized protein n=1 Tax=Microthlaspi erraticum TaxID=1685480 RepID=A0A6D2ICS7_9BRAS|nr:unnamed protein product [Microthlaspi erraticum]
MSREKTDVILKQVVKHFLVEKEVTSTLVIDFLFHGLKSLEEKGNKERTIHRISKQVMNLVIDDLESLENKLKCLDDETNAKEIPAATIVSVEKDMFVLVDDAMLLIEEAVPINRLEVGDVGERNEKLLTDVARRALEVFVLDHIFYNKIEVAYKEAIALKRQEELIRQEANSNNKRRTKKSTKTT